MIRKNNPSACFYAHSKEGRPPEEWQPLEEHLGNVAKLAAEFAKPFGGEEWARAAGLLHDLGKYSNQFQKKLYDANGIECHLETRPGRVIHSQAGGHVARVLEHPDVADVEGVEPAREDEDVVVLHGRPPSRTVPPG
jgi:HD superfamily phosphodiesterase